MHYEDVENTIILDITTEKFSHEHHVFLLLDVPGYQKNWFRLIKTYLDPFGRQIFEKYLDQFSLTKEFTI